LADAAAALADEAAAQEPHELDEHQRAYVARAQDYSHTALTARLLHSDRVHLSPSLAQDGIATRQGCAVQLADDHMSAAPALEVPHCVLSTATVVARLPEGSAARTLGLALLRKELLLYPELASKLMATTAADLTANTVPLEPYSQSAVVSCDVPLNGMGSTDKPVEVQCSSSTQSHTYAAVWEMLQKRRQQQQQQQQQQPTRQLSVAASCSAALSDTERLPSLGGTFGGAVQRWRQEPLPSAAANNASSSLNTCVGGPSCQVAYEAVARQALASLVFKRRGPTSAAGVMHHFNSKARVVRSDSTSVAAKSTHLFKKQRKRPLVLRYPSSIAAALAAHQDSDTAAAAAPCEQEGSISAGASVPPNHDAALTARCTAATLDGTAAQASGLGSPTWPASSSLSAPCAIMGSPSPPSSSMDSVLTKLAHQEQQLRQLQIQLRKQRELLAQGANGVEDTGIEGDSSAVLLERARAAACVAARALANPEVMMQDATKAAITSSARSTTTSTVGVLPPSLHMAMAPASSAAAAAARGGGGGGALAALMLLADATTTTALPQQHVKAQRLHGAAEAVCRLTAALLQTR
jgi:hypothetical protein